MNASETSNEAWHDLVDRIAAHDLRYLMGGSEWEGLVSPYASPDKVPLAPLLLDLARAPEFRLRNSLVALFLRHPDAVLPAETIAHNLPIDDPARLLLLVSIVVASALQHEWSFSLGLYLGDQAQIGADYLAVELGLPTPTIDFGRSCLVAAARLLRERDRFPFDYEATWEDVVHRLLDQLVREARNRGT